MILDFKQLSPNTVYHAMIQTLIPRPVAWVLSDNGTDNSRQQQDRWNLAPFSYFNALASNPPLLMLSIGQKPADKTQHHDTQLAINKDTRTNILERKYFTVHIAHREQAELVTLTSTSLPHGQSELALAQLDTTDFDGFATPRLKDCRIAYACQRHRIEDLTQTQGLIIAEIKKIYISDEVIQEQDDNKLKIDPLKVDPIARLGGNDYSFISDVLTVERPK